MTAPLRECPWCEGAKSVHIYPTTYLGKPYVAVECDGTNTNQHSMRVLGATEADAIAAWNRRPHALRPGLVKAREIVQRVPLSMHGTPVWAYVAQALDTALAEAQKDYDAPYCAG